MKLLFPCVLLFVPAAWGNELPEAPEPKAPNHATRIWIIEAGTLGALDATDFTLTARGLGPSNDEANPLFGPHPSNRRLTLSVGALYAAEVIVLWKTEHNRRRWVRWIGRAGFAALVV